MAVVEGVGIFMVGAPTESTGSLVSSQSLDMLSIFTSLGIWFVKLIKNRSPPSKKTVNKRNQLPDESLNVLTRTRVLPSHNNNPAEALRRATQRSSHPSTSNRVFDMRKGPDPDPDSWFCRTHGSERRKHKDVHVLTLQR